MNNATQYNIISRADVSMTFCNDHIELFNGRRAHAREREINSGFVANSSLGLFFSVGLECKQDEQLLRAQFAHFARCDRNKTIDEEKM